MGFHQTTLDPYGCVVTLVTDKRAWAKVKRVLPGLVDGNPYPAGDGWTMHSNWAPKNGRRVQHFVVVIRPDRQGSISDLLDTCAHEAVYITGSVMRRIGHRPKDIGFDEPWAYQVGWLTAWLWERAKEAYDAQAA